MEEKFKIFSTKISCEKIIVKFRSKTNQKLFEIQPDSWDKRSIQNFPQIEKKKFKNFERDSVEIKLSSSFDRTFNEICFKYSLIQGTCDSFPFSNWFELSFQSAYDLKKRAWAIRKTRLYLVISLKSFKYFPFKNANFEPKTSLCGPNIPLDIFRDRVQMGLDRSRTRSKVENMKIVIF